MFCPKCKYEYREGFVVCSDCNVALVDKLPQEEKKGKTVNRDSNMAVEYEYITTISSPGKIAVLKSILEAEKITYLISGEYNLKVPNELMVKKEQKEDVLEIMKVYNMDC